MTPDDQKILGALVLQRGKMLAPDRFPKPDKSVAEAWGRILGRLNVPLEVWPEAVDLWASERIGERMAIPATSISQSINPSIIPLIHQ